jgi:hypothetical protein
MHTSTSPHASLVKKQGLGPKRPPEISDPAGKPENDRIASDFD